MPIKYSIKTKIRINGKEFKSADEMSEEERKQYCRAMTEVAKNHGDIIETMHLGGRIESDGNARQIGEGYQPYPGTSSGGLRRVYRRIWFFLIVGFLSIFPAIWYASGHTEGGKLSLHTPYSWLLAIPAVLMLYAVYTSIRYWRCEHCGASLPTHSYSLTNESRCPRCGQNINF